MADVKISELPSAGALTGAELLALLQSSTLKNASLEDVEDYIKFGWVRPADWLPMPSPVAGAIHILAAVWDTGSNYAALRGLCTAGITIDWGDGTSPENVADNTDAYHEYDFDDADLDDTETSLGYKQVIITITPQSGSITDFHFNRKHDRSGLNNGYSQPWLDVQINCPAMTAFTFYGDTNAASRYLERVNIIAMGTPGTGNTFSQTFYDCFNLRVLKGFGPVWNTAGNFNNTLRHCHSMEYLDYDEDAFKLATGFTPYGCSVRNLPMHAGAWAEIGSASTSTFQFSALNGDIVFPAGSLGNVTSLGSFFAAGSIESHAPAGMLRSVVFPSGAIPGCTAANSAFTQQRKLQYVDMSEVDFSALNGSLGGMFNGCWSLVEVIFPATWGGTVTNTGNMFNQTGNIQRLRNCKIPISFSVASSKLSGAALDEIYTDLPTVTSQTITVTGNHGVADDDPTIATAKGWTVTG